MPQSHPHERIGVAGSEETILNLHKLSRGNVWDAGRYKDKPVKIIRKLPAVGNAFASEALPGEDA